MLETVTIAIPTRNRSDLLHYAMKSCQRLSGSNFEFLIVDNASTDSTRKVCESFSHDSRFKIVRYEISGSINDQFERCWQHSSGDWLCIIGDDDCVLPDFDCQINALLSSNYAKNMKMIRWSPVIYRWPSFASNEANRLSFWGCLDRLRDIPFQIFNNNDFVGSVNKNGLKYIYQLPGIYHGLCRKSLVSNLVDAIGLRCLFYLSPDISFQIAASLFQHKALSLLSPLTLAGYSASSTGSAFAGNDSMELRKKYLDENPQLVAQALEVFPCLESLIASENFTASEVLLTYLITVKLCNLTNNEDVSLITYIQSECDNAAKLAPSARPLIVQQLNAISKSSGIKIGDDMLSRFDSASPSRSLATGEQMSFKPLVKDQWITDEHSVQRLQVHFSGDASKKEVENSFEAARLACAIMDSGSYLVK